MSGKLSLKRCYERIASIEPFYTGGAIALARSGQVLVCTCGGEVKVVDATTGAVRISIEADSEQVTALALAPNGQEIITAGRDFLAKTWEESTGTKIRSWKVGQGQCYVQRLVYDDTSTLAAGGCSDGIVRVWDAGRGFATHNLRGHRSLITSLCFGSTPKTDPNRLLLFSGADDGEVRVWALATKSCKAVLKSHDSAITAMAIHVPTKTLLTGARDRVVCVWDLKQMKLSSSVPIYDTIEGLVVVPPHAEKKGETAKGAGSKPAKKKKKGAKEVAEATPEALPVMTSSEIEFMTAGTKGVLKRWRVGGGKCLLSETERAGSSAYTDLIFDETSGNLLGVTIDQGLLYIEPHTLQVAKQMVGHNEEIVDVAFASSDLIAVCTNTDHLRVFNISTRSCRFLYGHTDIILAVDCSTVGGVMVTSSKDRMVRVWCTESGRCIGVAEGHVDSVGAVAIAQRNRQFAVSGSKDMTVKVWDMKKAHAAARNTDSTEVAIVPVLRTWKAHDKDINSIAVSPNEALVATGSADRTVKLWDSATGKAMGICKGHKRGVWCVKFSPVDKIVASSSVDSTLKLWSISDSSCLKTFEGHEGSVLKLAFVCSGMQLLSAGSDGLVKLWTIKTCECVDSFDHHTDKVWALSVAPGDDTLVVTGGADSIINIWDDKTQELDQKKFEESQKTNILEQDLMNALREKDFRKAAILAFELKQPFRLLQVIQEVISVHDEGVLDKIVKKFTEEQLDTCLVYIRDWNTTSRNSHAAQVMLNCILRSYRMDKLSRLPSMKDVVDALIPYTERHYQRIEDAVQKTYYLDYVLHATSAVGGEMQDDADQIQEVKPRKRAHSSNGVDEQPAATQDVEMEDDAESDVAGDGEGIAGWGDWGGGDDAESEEDASEDDAEETAKSVHKNDKKPPVSEEMRQRGGGEGLEGKHTTPAKSGKQVSLKAKDLTTPKQSTKVGKSKTTGKKSKPRDTVTEDEVPAKRRKSLDSAKPGKKSGTPPVSKRLRSAAVA